ncbi:ATP-binding protein [Methanocalculus taiwanensis]|uniref:ATP-binding protein n=1 Tax=Methanocalculus taiwanensis TaxID=106207 RepID=A0ABD4TM37_9EURY|nr:ATP-binding protein [Methanocalculus taiwanensis]MCQ1538340.1 ATP-binding protein [Methanocalculus taiwanensis]
MADHTTLRLMELLLTAEIVNREETLGIADLTPACRKAFSIGKNGPDLKRPFIVSNSVAKRALGIDEAHNLVKSNPFIGFDDFGQRLSITALDPAARWFLERGGRVQASANPVLAFYYEKIGADGIAYKAAVEANPRYEDSRAFLEPKIEALKIVSEDIRDALGLVTILAPEEIEESFESFVATPDQLEMIGKIKVAVANREFLKNHQIYQVGRLLFVGPPGTGKTSFALSLARELHMPILEARLSMITSQYLGETSKNIDRIFEIAKRLAPCILFIDEFDYVARTRDSDDHGAMKRAVNTLLKSIDQISLIKSDVLFIGATNHPGILDEAAWRRFDEAVPFTVPDIAMRQAILESITRTLRIIPDLSILAARTEGFTGADLRLMVKEAIMAALIEGRDEITEVDVEQGMLLVDRRNALRKTGWIGA